MGAHQGVTRLFYDGDCGLCRGAARFAARHDRLGQIRFAPLRGETFKRLVPAAPRMDLPDSLVLLTPEGDLLAQSGAVIHLLRRMGPGWRLVGTMLAWFPEPLRDAAYRLFARLRPRGRACALDASIQDDRLDP
jgi:predicted DCC family thiol-disulfide oxidoreductase YuxK